MRPTASLSDRGTITAARTTAPRTDGFSDRVAFGVQAQQLAELAQQLVIHRQSDRPVGKLERRALHQRADVEKRRRNQTPRRTPGLAFVFRDHQFTALPAQPPTDTLTK